MQWELTNRKSALKTFPFEVEELSFLEKRNKNPLPHTFFRINSPSWVNILPITSDGQAILIRQPRAGSLSDVLETPGGCIDPGEKDPTMSAVRELEEETGFSTQRILPLASLNPNPALMNNKVHMFLALNCTPVMNRKHFPDESERIETVLVPAKSLAGLVRRGEMDNCLAALCIFLAAKYVDVGLSEAT